MLVCTFTLTILNPIAKCWEDSNRVAGKKTRLDLSVMTNIRVDPQRTR